MKLTEGIVKPRDAAQRTLSLGQQAGGTVGVVGAVKTLHTLIDGIGELLRVLQDLAPCFELFIFAGLQVRSADLVDLIAQRFHAAQLFSLVHAQLCNLTPELGNNRKSFLISQMQLLVASKCIQKVQMVFLIKEGSAVVLAVDVDELDAQLM